MKYKLLLTLCGVMLSTQVVFAEKEKEANIFKCTNKQGDIFYNDKPCPKQDEEKKLRAIKDPKNSSGNVNANIANLDSSSALKAENAKWDAIDREIQEDIKLYEKSKKGKSSSSNKSTASTPNITKQDIAAMTGSQKENYEEHMALEQQQIAREAEATQNK